MSSLGTVSAKITLDQTTQTYRGNESPVHGTVDLTWLPPPGKTLPELFGPLYVDLLLEGMLQSYLNVTSDPYGEEYIHKCFEDRKLCRKVTNLHDTSAKMLPHKPLSFPFEIHFPSTARAHHVESSLSDNCRQTRDEELGRSSGQPLPPSMHIRTALGRVGGSARVTYTLTCDVRMPGLEVAITPRLKTEQVLKYDVAPENGEVSSETSLWPETYTISNKYLLPERERPKGFSLLSKRSTYPTFCFSLLLSKIPRYIVIGQPMPLNLSLILLPNDSTITDTPAITIQSCKAWLMHNTVLENSKTRSKSDVQKLDGDTETSLGFQATPSVLTEGELLNGQRYDHKIILKPIKDVPCTFAMDDIQISYRLRFEVRVVVAKEVVNFASKHIITLLSSVKPPSFEAATSDGKNVSNDDAAPYYTKQILEQLNAQRGGVIDYEAHVKSLVSITPWGRKKHKQRYEESLRRYDELVGSSSQTTTTLDLMR